MRRVWIIAGSLAVIAALPVAGVRALSAPSRTLFTLHDDARGRDVPVQISASGWTLVKERLGFAPKIAVVSHGNTVKHTEYYFIGKVLFQAGYLVVSIQHDLPGDPPLAQSGFPYVGRSPVYQRAVANIDFVLDNIRTMVPNAELSKLTLLGHSNGGDISMYYAMQRSERIVRIVTLDNRRVPLQLPHARPAILSIRSDDWKPDPGIVPDDEICRESKIELIRTNVQHVDMSDRGPEPVKAALTAELRRFLSRPDNSPPQGRTIYVNVKA